MSKPRSGGILLYRLVTPTDVAESRDADASRGDQPPSIQVYLAHPGGPFFRKKHEGYWGIPKGLLEGAEDEAAAARREFEEETGFLPPEPLTDLGSIRQKSGKTVHAFAARWDHDHDPPKPQSNTFPMEWPPRSGETIEVPEIDEARFFDLEVAKRLMNRQQWELVERLLEIVGGRSATHGTG